MVVYDKIILGLNNFKGKINKNKKKRKTYTVAICHGT